MSAGDDFFTLFKDRWQLASEAEREQREHELADLVFESGEHWDPKIKRDRAAAGQPTLTIDLLSGPIKRITNMQRTARPGISIDPVGHGADDEQAERWQGVIRRIERLSGAHRVYTWAGQHQVKMGRGFWVVRNVEVGDDGEQDIRLEEVENQHSIYCDPTCKKLNGEDKQWAIRWEDLTHEEYKRRFPGSPLSGRLGEAFSGVGDSVPEWLTTKHARIAEYCSLQETTRTRLVLSTGTGVWEDELPTVNGRVGGKFAKVPQLPEGATVKRTVKKKTAKVHWCLLNGAGERLETTMIPGTLIPVVMVYGERRMVDGKRDFRGMVRMAKGPSIMEDFCESSLMEAISLAKSAPWLAEEEQIAEYEAEWRSLTPPKVYKYKRQDIQGHPIPPPSRVSSDVDVTALTLAAQRMQNHIRNGLGNADVFQEETRQEQSGRAILARKQAQELETSDYMENLGDGIVLTAKIVMGMARQVYDTPRLLRITGEDEKELEILTHAGTGPDQQHAAQRLAQGRKGIKGMLDVTLGEYDITVSAGRSYATARQESVQMIAALPEPIQMVGSDIYVGNMDFPGNVEFAKRLKKMNPAAQEEQPDTVPVAEAQQAQQVIDALTQTVTTLQQQIDSKAAEAQSRERIAAAEIASKERIAAASEETKRLVAQLEGQRDIALAKLEHVTQTREHAHEVGMESMRAVHEDDADQHAAADAFASGAVDHARGLEAGEAEHGHAVDLLTRQPKKPNGKG